MIACDCGVPAGKEMTWVHRRECAWQRSLVCCCPADEAGARASACLACRWSHRIGPDGLGCPWVRAEEARREREWCYARDIVLGALAAAGVEVITEDGMPRFFRMRADLWSPSQQDRFARDLLERLETRPGPDDMFAPHTTVEVVINFVVDYLREKGLFIS